MKNLIKKYSLGYRELEYYPDDGEYYGVEDEYGYVDWVESFTGYSKWDNPIFNLPSWEPFRGLKDDTRENRHKYYRDCPYCKRAGLILHGSIGRDANETLNKVRKLLNYCNRGPEEYIRHNIAKIYYENGKRYFNYHTRRYYHKAFYIENGILYRSEIDRPFKFRKSWRRTYERRTKRRAQNKQEREDKSMRADLVLSMINKPDLMAYYMSLTDTYKKLCDMKTKAMADPPTKEKDERDNSFKWRKWRWGMDKRRFTKSEERRMSVVRRQLERLGNREFDAYYDSNMYIYSLSKECHHFSHP